MQPLSEGESREGEEGRAHGKGPDGGGRSVDLLKQNHAGQVGHQAHWQHGGEQQAQPFRQRDQRIFARGVERVQRDRGQLLAGHGAVEGCGTGEKRAACRHGHARQYVENQHGKPAG